MGFVFVIAGVVDFVLALLMAVMLVVVALAVVVEESVAPELVLDSKHPSGASSHSSTLPLRICGDHAGSIINCGCGRIGRRAHKRASEQANKGSMTRRSSRGAKQRPSALPVKEREDTCRMNANAPLSHFHPTDLSFLPQIEGEVSGE
jgi:hypothetical protein